MTDQALLETFRARRDEAQARLDDIARGFVYERQLGYRPKQDVTAEIEAAYRQIVKDMDARLG